MDGQHVHDDAPRYPRVLSDPRPRNAMKGQRSSGGCTAFGNLESCPIRPSDAR